MYSMCKRQNIYVIQYTTDMAQKRSALSGTALSSTQRCPGQSSAWLSAVWDSVQLDSRGSGQRSVWLNAVPDSAQLDSKLHLGQCSAWLSALMLSIQCSAGLNAVGTMPSLNKRCLGHCSVWFNNVPDNAQLDSALFQTVLRFVSYFCPQNATICEFNSKCNVNCMVCIQYLSQVYNIIL